MWIFANYVGAEEPAIGELSLVIPISIILLVCLAYLVTKLLDFTIRGYLKDKLRANASRQ